MPWPRGKKRGHRTPGSGRKAGTPNKATKDLREAIIHALDRAGGEDYLTQLAHENPTPFASLLGRCLPSQHNLTGKVGVGTLAEFLREQDESK